MWVHQHDLQIKSFIPVHWSLTKLWPWFRSGPLDNCFCTHVSKSYFTHLCILCCWWNLSCCNVTNKPWLLYRRRVGYYRRADPRSPEIEKGYRLRDTDDRLHRMKSQAQIHRSSCVSVNKSMNGNGKCRLRALWWWYCHRLVMVILPVPLVSCVIYDATYWYSLGWVLSW